MSNGWVKPEVVILPPGGNKGFILLGALIYFERIDLLSEVKHWIGCSVGSIISLLKIIGMSSLEIIINFSSMGLFNDVKAVDTLSILSGYGLVDHDVIRNKLQNLLIEKYGFVPTMEQLYTLTGLEFTVITTEIEKESICLPINRHNFSDLSCIEAVIRSSSIPYIFKRLKDENNITYIDGAFTNPYPINLVDDGETSILGINIDTNPGEDDDSHLWYLKTIGYSSINQLRRNIIANSSEMCKHFNLNCDNLPFNGLIMNEEIKGKLIKSGDFQAKIFAENYDIQTINNIKLNDTDNNNVNGNNNFINDLIYEDDGTFSGSDDIIIVEIKNNNIDEKLESQILTPVSNLNIITDALLNNNVDINELRSTLLLILEMIDGES